MAGSTAVVIPLGPFLASLQKGQGVCIPKAGPPTSQATPAAPSATCPAVSGNLTLRYACVGYDARGGLTAASPIGTVSGAALGPCRVKIQAISRDANGILTITTAEPHGFKYQPNSRNQTLIGVEGCYPFNVNGRFVAFWPAITGFDPFPTPTTIICVTDRQSAVTGQVGAASLVSVWSFVTVACPPLSGTTIGYYIYSDSPNPGQSLVLIGKCLLGECHFDDHGPDLAAGYRAPGYVPTSPPTEPQNQLFTTTIASLNPTTLASPPPTSVSSVMLFDDGVNLQQAMAAAASGLAGCVLISAPREAMPFPGYIFNSSPWFPEGIRPYWNCRAIINETLTWTQGNDHDAPFGSPQYMQGLQFGQRDYVDIGGIANPFFNIGEDRGNSGAVRLQKLGFTCYSNGQVAVLIRSAFYCNIKDCGFMSAGPNAGTAVGLVCLGSCSLIELEDTSWQFTNKFQSNDFHPGPPLPAIWFRSSDNPNIPNGQLTTGNILMRGKHTFYGRGILIDHLYAGSPQTLGAKIGDMLWIQAASTPSVMCWGQQFIGFDLDGILNDTSQEAVIANWSTYELNDVRIRNCRNNLQPLTTGKPIAGLTVSASSQW